MIENDDDESLNEMGEKLDLIREQLAKSQMLSEELESLELDKFSQPLDGHQVNLPELEIKYKQLYDMIMKYSDFINDKSGNKDLLRSSRDVLITMVDCYNSIMVTMRSCLDAVLRFRSWDEIDWDDCKDNDQFSEQMPLTPQLKAIPSPPTKEDQDFQPRFSLIDKLFYSRRERRIRDAEKSFIEALKLWEKDKNDISQENNKVQEQYLSAVDEWEKRINVFIKEQENNNQGVDLWKNDYFKGKADAVVRYCKVILSSEVLPTFLQNEFEIDYNEKTKSLIIEYYFPSPNAIPNIKELKYIKSKNKIEEIQFSESECSKNYDKLIFGFTLMNINGLIVTDIAKAIDSVAFNGWTKSLDETTGHQIVTCILSIYVSAEQMREIDISAVDPQKCFKALKGISASKLYNLTAIAPILKISKADKRFVQSHEVASKLDEVTNVAAMGWEDFEHLIREIFEKELSQSGGEVKVTQASRDGGVDAIAFDPDPIRGGKIVIQAKRYTNTVGVSAVRDLYGSLINEGATKGILITTADYGPDAYEFAKGKPLTLLNGNNLLYLLEKHGHKAIIDLKAAKRLLSLEDEGD